MPSPQRLLRLVLLVCATLTGLVARPASADLAVVHPELSRAVARLSAARGPEAYDRLRDIWSLWDRADPDQVEEALVDASAQAALGAPLRAYAGLLVAYARLRRGDLQTAKKQVMKLGYVEHWLVVGPFDDEGKDGLGIDFGPEKESGRALEGVTYPGKQRPVHWRAVPEQAFPYGYVDLRSMLRPETKVCGYLRTFVRPRAGARAPKKITAWVGSAGSFALFWNGRRVLDDPAYRGHDVDRQAATLELRPGVNDLLLKVCDDERAPIGSVRLADARGAADADIETTIEPSAVLEAKKNREAAPAKDAAEPRAKRAAGPEGPMQAFARLIAAKTPKASDLQAYAEYLASTGGDDPAKHDARDLAARSANQEPTVERLLLAGSLAEDRNHRAEWVERAVKLAGKHPTTELLLAQAALARSGPNPRDAFPIYERVLSMNQDDLGAIRGRVELYEDAGLRRTALALLERAMERQPHSVLLLNMVASELRALGRSTDAAEVEHRYAGLRFDDGTYLSSMIDLALARRDRAAAERWIERLLGGDPDGQWALSVAARAYRALGQPERAIATHERALGLAPEDTATLRTLADLHGELGHKDEQLELLRRILELAPQDADTRQYVEMIEPPKQRPDEAYAWDADRFLRLRHQPPAGQNTRTLHDLTVTTVFANGLSSRFRQVVFQPLTDAAAAIARQYAFSYQADRQAVQLRGAKVYRSDGRIDEAVESGEAAADNPDIASYTSARTFWVQLPRLDAGDVVELRYRIEDTSVENEFSDYFGDVAYLQGTEPVFDAEYVLITPSKRKFLIDTASLPGLEHTETQSGEQTIHRFSIKDLAPVTPEPSMPPWPEVLGFVHVSTFTDYNALGRWYWGLAKEQFDLDDETRKLAREIAKNAKNDVEKVKAVYGWVIKNTRYVALEFGIYGYKPRRCVQTVARGWGDCKDKATVIVTLLEELGIPATIVIVRTQMRGDFKSNVASLAPFDHAIAYVPSLDLYLDGTAEHTGSSELPSMDVGALAVQVNQGNAKLVRLPAPKPGADVRARTVTAQLSADGGAKLDIAYETKGTSASDWRRRYGAEATLRQRVGEDLGSEFPGFEITEPNGVTVSDLADLEQPVKLHAKGATKGFTRREDGQLSMPVTTNARLTPSFASLSRRQQDVVIGPFSTIEDTFVVKLPAGMKVSSKPPASKGETRFGSWSVEVEASATQVVVKSRLEVKVLRVEPKDYAEWVAFCGEVDRALSSRLVVGK